MTLSRFLKEYIYIPLGGNRAGKYRTYFNLLITFLLGGIWHGASWMFVVWGALHGMAIAAHRMWSRLGFKTNNIFGWIITFNFVNFSWIFFRARSWDDALKVIKGMFGLSNIVLPRFLAAKLAFLSKYGVTFGLFMINVESAYTNLFIIYLFLAIVLSGILVVSAENSNYIILRYKPLLKYNFIVATLLYLSVLYLTPKSEFLYFNF
jgi:hypothetical protein